MTEFKTIKTFTDDILQEIESRTSGKISNPVTGSVIRSIVEAISTTFFFIQTMIKKVYQALYIEKAYGLFLDALAKNFLIERKQATYATGIVNIVRQNHLIEEILPAGTIFMTEDINTSTQKKYFLLNNVRFPSGVTEMEGVIQAESLGTSGNTAKNTVTYIQNTTIPILEVTNDDDISNGVDTERDDELRDRIYLKILSLLGGNARVIRSAALEVEGVVYTFIVDDRIIPGIAYLFVNNKNGDIDSSIVDEVKAKVEEVRPMGVIIHVSKSPVNVVSLWLKLKIRNGFFDSNIITNIKTQLANYVNSLKPSQCLRKSDLIGFIEQIPGVDFVVNSPTAGGLQIKINDEFNDITDINSMEMIRTTTDLIEIEII